MPDKMTPAQERAVKHRNGACLVLAGPGSGKTFVITNRLFYMVKEYGIPSEHILVITFTKAAATEMEERFRLLLPDEHPWFGTFHSCFYYILRNSYSSIPERFISQEEKHQILQEICERILDKEAGIETEEVERLLGLYMNNGLSMQKMQQFADIKPEELKEIYRSYHTALVQYGYMDFDDMMLCCYQLLKDNPDVRKKWQEQFRYILIDECQDMNVLQYEIIKLLAGTERNVFMVGDDDQSVYRFRGARVELMQRFTEEYTPISKVELDMNFRSTAGIVGAAIKVIKQNKHRFDKKLKASHPEKEGVLLRSFELRKEMYEHMLESFQKASEDNLDNCAVVYRTNRELQNMAYKMRQKGIPYQSLEDKKSMFDEDWYLDVEAYMHLGLGSLERKHILRVANKPNRFIKREQLVDVTGLPDPLATSVKHIGAMRPVLAMKYIWSGIGYGRWLERNLGTDTERYDVICEQMEEISQAMKEYPTLKDWLEHVEEDRILQKNMQKSVTAVGKETKKGVHLLTMHASKGLEFDRVYLPDVNKSRIPKGAKLTQEEMEEERRLFYVAMTRAKKELHIYYVKGSKDHPLQPSVFLKPLL